MSSVTNVCVRVSLWYYFPSPTYLPPSHSPFILSLPHSSTPPSHPPLSLPPGYCAKCEESVIGMESGCLAAGNIYHTYCFSCSRCCECMPTNYLNPPSLQQLYTQWRLTILCPLISPRSHTNSHTINSCRTPAASLVSIQFCCTIYPILSLNISRPAVRHPQSVSASGQVVSCRFFLFPWSYVGPSYVGPSYVGPPYEI